MGVFSENAIIGASAAGDYEIEKSVVLGDSSYFSRTPSSAGNRTTWTLSFWTKRGMIANSANHVLDVYTDASNRFYISIPQTDKLDVYASVSNSAVLYGETTAVFRDPASWAHYVCVYDSTDSTAADRFKVFANGVRQDFTYTNTPGLNQELACNSTTPHYIGAYQNGASNFYDGYLAEMHFIDGTALDASSFGETNADTNQWVPIKYAGSYGTNGFYLDFATRATDPIDASGNGNNWSSTNVIAGDWKIDTPTNNFATLNPLDPAANHGTSTFKEGNLRIDLSGGNYKYSAVGNGAMSTGKWYFEFCAINSDNSQMLGVADITKGLDRGYTGSSGDGLYIYVDGDKYSPTSSSSYGVSWTYGDVMGIAVDMDNNAMYFAKNNTWMNSGDPTSGSSKTGAAYTTELSGKTWVAAMGRGGASNTNSGTFNFGQDSSFAGAKTAQGNQDGNGIGDFYYTPPSGFVALCSDNLSDPSIADPTAHFNTVLYTGNGSNPRSITGVGFQPDFHWRKKRNAARSHNLHDVVRGAPNFLYMDATVAEVSTDGNGTLSSFDSDGFTFNSEAGDENTNNSGDTYVTWNWKAGGTASSNTDGSITSSVSANTTAGFSIVGWTGTGSNVTVGHGLSQAPDLIINKTRSTSGVTSQWVAQSILWQSATDTNLLYLNGTNAASDDTNVFQAAPTATVFSPQGGGWSGIGVSGENYIAYCFHSVAGYSKVAYYKGNGNQNGSFVYTGFRPAFIFIKRVTNSGSNSYIVDNKRIGYNHFVYLTDAGSNKYLWPDSNAAEGNGNTTKGIGMDILSNGFKFRTSGGDYNASGNDYFFYAVAEFPFKYANAR